MWHLTDIAQSGLFQHKIVGVGRRHALIHDTTCKPGQTQKVDNDKSQYLSLDCALVRHFNR